MADPNVPSGSRLSNLAAFIAFLILLTGPARARSQSSWTDQRVRSGLSLEILKPSFEGEDGLTFITTVNYLSGRFAIGRASMLELELPIPHAGVKSGFAVESETAIGNPYIGLFFSGGSDLVGRIGVRLPLASEENFSAMNLGFMSDYDRLEAFIPEVVAAVGSIGSRQRPFERFEIIWGLGPLLLVSTENVGTKVELFAQYQLQSVYHARSFSAGGGFTGRGVVTDQQLDFGERTVHHLTLFGLGHFSSIHPGLYVRFPLDEDFRGLDFVSGLHVTIEIG